MSSFLVVEETDTPGRDATTRWRVTPQTVTAAWITAAQALVTATFGANLLSIGGVTEAYYEHDLVLTPFTPGVNSDVRKHWQITNQPTGKDSERQQIGAPLLTNNIQTGTRILANISSTAWAAYIAAVGATAFGWLGEEGDSPDAVVGAVYASRGRKASRIRVKPTPTPKLGGFLVVNAVDSEGAHARLRVRVTPQVVTAGWITAANAVLTAVYGSGGLSLAGYRRAYYRHDFLSSAITAQANTTADTKWVTTCRDGSGNVFKIQVPIPGESGNLQGGSKELANTSSADWVAFINALTAPALAWIGNEGGASPVVIGARSTSHARKAPREIVRG